MIYQHFNGWIAKNKFPNGPLEPMMMMMMIKLLKKYIKYGIIRHAML